MVVDRHLGVARGSRGEVHEEPLVLPGLHPLPFVGELLDLLVEVVPSFLAAADYELVLQRGDVPRGIE